MNQARAATFSWDLIATFLAVMKGGSLSAAARSLGIAQPTVRRHIEELEGALGVVLFTRSPAGLTPTDAAQAVLAHAEGMAGLAGALVRATQTDRTTISGTLRLSCSEIMATEVIPALIAPLLAAHPLLDIELVATNVSDDLLRRDADIAVRMVRPTQTGLIARKIGDVPLGLYASPAYLAAMPMPRSISALVDTAVLIGEDRGTAMATALARIAPGSKAHFRLRTDSDATQLAAVRAGIGIGICQRPIAAADPRLQVVLPDLELSLECWVVMHEDLRHQPKARALFDHLVTTLTGYVGGSAEPQIGAS